MFCSGSRTSIFASHRDEIVPTSFHKGWEQLTDAVIKKLNERNVPTAFILWGGNAKAKAPLITNPIHAVFKAAHPSPLSAYNGFFGCRHFSKVNDFLVSNNIQPIDWTISNK